MLLFKKKLDENSVKEVAILKKRVAKLEKELERVEKLEQGLAQNELLIAKKITDMNWFEEELKSLVSKHELEELKKELNRFEEYELALYENTKFLQEITKELGKVKESHKLTRKHVMSDDHVSKTEFEDKLSSVKESLQDLDKIRSTHKKKAGNDDLKALKKELHDRLSQVEYQNKLLMKYLKKVDEVLQSKA